MDLPTAALLIGAGVVAGVVNTLAGGGSMVALPVLMIAGLPTSAANATNRVGVLVASLSALGGYRSETSLRAVLDPVEIVPACVGAVLGARVAVSIDGLWLDRVVGVALLVVLGTLFADPSATLGPKSRRAPAWARVLGFLAVGFYGGFLQVGVGFFLLAALVLLSGRDLVSANAVKVLLVLLFTVPALAVYVWSGQVAWGTGLVLAIGSSIGGWVGARLTIAGGATLVKGAMVVTVLTFASHLFGWW